MTKVEKQFRKILKDKYFALRDELCYGKSNAKNIIHYEYDIMRELSEQLFPNIDVDRCETLWFKEWKKLNLINY